ncbi:ribose ABC transporter permease [Spiroplasma helicoides]|uniref:Ribose ABC transporter permease n=1 Tax=Spiroplasma helicoides TaxID=216938 RepID=A0A1B3SLW5_9MOLU|nr:ABC transporter permease [Spiroplasma helicoides]AOG60907.1 ribose ABC transporter permease [Spiroplasma helicoides]
MESLKKYNIIDNVIDYSAHVKDMKLKFINDFYDRRVEKKVDKIYELSSYRDIFIESIKKKKDKKINKLVQEKTNLDYKYKNKDIDKSLYESLDLQLNLEKRTIEIENFYKEVIIKKEKKWNVFIDKKRAKYKLIINKINAAREKHCNKVEELLKNQINVIETKSSQILEIENKEFANNAKILQNYKYNKNLIEDKNKLELNKIGPLDYEKKSIFNSDKVDEKTKQLNLISNSKEYKKLRGQINSKFLFDFSTKVKIKDKTISTINSFKLVIFIMIFTIGIGVAQPLFFTTQNWINILSQNAALGCFAIGVTLIILTGGIDLSIGSTLAFSTAIGAKMIVDGNNIWVVLIMIVVFSSASGLISGVLVSYFKLPPFIVTLVLMLVWRGATYIKLENKIIPFESDFLNFLTQYKIFAIPLIVYILFALAIVVGVLMKFSRYGRSIYAMGGNYKAAELSGIKVKPLLLSVYVFGGICMAFGSLIYMARVKVATPTTGNAWELDAIACVVLGGTSLNGGKGGVVQTMIGWFVMSVLTNALVVVGIDSNIQFIIKGVVILIAILSNTKITILNRIYKKTKMYLKI